MKHLISIFGTPISVFSNNGGEFASKDFIAFCENFSIEIKTPVESTWNNGICEHHNEVITETLLKVKQDSNCDWETVPA